MVYNTACLLTSGTAEVKLRAVRVPVQWAGGSVVSRCCHVRHNIEWAQALGVGNPQDALHRIASHRNLHPVFEAGPPAREPWIKCSNCLPVPLSALYILERLA